MMKLASSPHLSRERGQAQPCAIVIAIPCFSAKETLDLDDAEIVFDTETTGLDSARRPRHRARRHRARQSLPDRPHLPPIHQSAGPRRSTRSAGEARHLDGPARRLSRASPTSPKTSWNSSMAHIWSPTMPASDIAFINAARRSARTAARRAVARGRHAGDRQAQASDGAELARRALPPLRHRQQPPHQARRAARLRTPGGSLHRADRRQAGRARPRHDRRRARRQRSRSPPSRSPSASARRRLPPASPRRSLPRTACWSRSSARSAIWLKMGEGAGCNSSAGPAIASPESLPTEQTSWRRRRRGSPRR